MYHTAPQLWKLLYNSAHPRLAQGRATRLLCLENSSLLLLLNNFWGVPARLSSGCLTVKCGTAMLAARRAGECWADKTPTLKCCDNFLISKAEGGFPTSVNAFWLPIKRESSSIIPTNLLLAVTCVLRSLLFLQKSGKLSSRFLTVLPFFFSFSI